jgi:hypothetical protein
MGADSKVFILAERNSQWPTGRSISSTRELITTPIVQLRRAMALSRRAYRNSCGDYFPMSLRWSLLVKVAIPLSALIGVVGCGGPYDASVSGVVTLDGNVVPRGTVAFQPVAGGPPAYGPIADDGSYTIRTGREEGLPSGEYAVTVTANELPTVQQTASGGPPPPGKAITPPWYRSKETSGLRFTVESGANGFDLELKSQPPPGWKPAGRR